MAFGTGRNFRHIHINAICNALGREKSVAFPSFHSFTGCDTTSTFFGKRKKSAWEAWKSFPVVTNAFLYMAVLLSLTRQTTWNLSVRHGESCSVRTIGQWKQFHQHKMFCCNAVDELSTRLTFGAQAIKLIRSCKSRRIWLDVGHRTQVVSCVGNSPSGLKSLY